MIKIPNLENNSFNRLFLFIFTLVVLVVSMLTPPFQSPDEMAHFKRAYTLSQGQFFLDKRGDGLVDKSLIDFEKNYNTFPFHYDQKNSFSLEAKSRAIHWSYEQINISLVNTAVYFPIAYIPQAIGIKIGTLFNLSIFETYKIAKFSSIVLCLLFIYLANKTFPITPLGYFFLSLPMAIFQISSTSTDGILFSLSMLCGALLYKGIYKGSDFNIKDLFILCGVFFILSTNKMNILPIFILLVLACNMSKIRCGYRFSFITLMLIFSWILFSYIHFSGDFNQGGVTVSDKIKFYLENPTQFLIIFYNTFTSIESIEEYIKQFIGVLGWLDTPLNYNKYIFITIIGMLIFFSGLKKISSFKIFCINLFAFFSVVFITFLLLLLTWTPLTENIIHGIQGRYFIPLVIIFSYFISRDNNFNYALVFVMLFTSSLFSISAISYRYILGL